MISAWYSIRAFVVVVAMVGFLVLCKLAHDGQSEALVAVSTLVGIVFTFYFASPTGAGGSPHGPTT